MTDASLPLVADSGERAGWHRHDVWPPTELQVRGIDGRPGVPLPSPSLEHRFESGARSPASRPRETLRRVEASKRKTDALMQGFNLYLIDGRRKPASPLTRYDYTRRILKAIDIARAGGYSLLAGDERVIRYVLMQVSPHPRTRNGYISALRALFEFMRKEGLRRDDPTADLVRPIVRRTLPRPMTFEQCVAYEGAAIRLGPFHEMIATLGLYQGWRRDEMRLAQWGWFFRAGPTAAHPNGWFADVRGKGDSQDRDPLHDHTLAALERLRGLHADPVWLFPSPQRVRAGEAASTQWMMRRHKETLQAAGLDESLVLHQLRHSCATMLGPSGPGGASKDVVQMKLRHRDPKSTDVYTEVLPTVVCAPMNRVSFRPTRLPGQPSLFDQEGS